MTKVIFLYMPVIHQGYISFLERHYPADIVLLTAHGCKKLNEKIADRLSRDIRCIPAEEVATFLHEKYPALRIQIFDNLDYFMQFKTLIMLDEDVSYALKDKLPEMEVVFDNQFLRWDWRNTNIPKEVIADYEISTDEFDRHMMSRAENEAIKSSDFWRQVGAVVPFKDETLIVCNKHMPTNMEPYINGDMRLNMNPGENPEICNALHAERGIIAEVAKPFMRGKDMYVTTFPCLGCAQMLAAVEIKRLFFKEGYSNQNAVEVLRAAKIEIIQVK